MLLSFGLVFLLASAHALPTRNASDEIDDKSIIDLDAPELTPVVKAPTRTRTSPKKKVDTDDSSSATQLDNEVEIAQRKFLAPLLSNIGSMLGNNNGNVLENLVTGAKPLFSGLIDMLRNYGIQQINSNKPVSRVVVLILEATRFLMEIMDFFSKRGTFITKIIVTICKVIGRIFGIFSGGVMG